MKEVSKYLVYLRKSRAEEHESVEEVLARHEKQLQEYAVKIFGEPISEENIYREVVSGETIDNRPQMQALLRRIEKQLIDGVLVIEPQRLSRGDMIDAGTVVRAFQYTRTKIITPQKTYDLDDKFDRKFFEMELRQGNDYLEYVKEILQRGRIFSVKNGNYIGSSPPYGYKKVKDGKNFTLEIIPDEAEIVKRIFDMFVNERLGSAQICNILNGEGKRTLNGQFWKPDRIREMLHNPIYIGKLRWNYRKTKKIYEDGKIRESSPRNLGEDVIIADGKHPHIIDEEIFSQAQGLFKKPIKLTNNKELRNVFAGISHCECGYAMSYITDGGRAKPRLCCNNRVNCPHKSVIYDEYVEAVKKSLEQTLEDYQTIVKGNKRKKEDYRQSAVNSIKKEIQKLDEQEERLYSFLEDGTYSRETFVKRRTLLEEKRMNLQKTLVETESNVKEKMLYQDAIIKLKHAIKMIDDSNITAKAKNKFLREIIEDIIYSRLVPKEKRRFRDEGFTIEIKLKI